MAIKDKIVAGFYFVYHNKAVKKGNYRYCYLIVILFLSHHVLYVVVPKLPY